MHDCRVGKFFQLSVGGKLLFHASSESKRRFQIFQTQCGRGLDAVWKLHLMKTRGGGGVTAPPDRGTFFRLSVYIRVGISQVEVYEKVWKSII